MTLLSDVLERFGKRLRSVREKVGVSQEKLAEMAELHRTYVSSVERGKRNISLLNIERLARALKVSMAELMPDAKKDR
jgi:transcriptional regulator with XRE-family HTH domain